MKYLLLLGSIGIATALRFAQLLAQPSHMDAAANFPPQVVAASEPANYANPGTFPSTVNLQPTPLEALSRQSASGISRQVGLNAVAADELRMLMATLRQHQAMAEPAETGLRTDR
ncbi:MAG: hypothetical protein ABI905_13080, partial [Betaproteobacteria bacterium]